MIKKESTKMRLRVKIVGNNVFECDNVEKAENNKTYF